MTMSRSHKFEDTDRQRMTDAGAQRAPQAVADPPSMFAVGVTGVLVIIFAIQLIGVVIGVLPADASGGSRMVFGVVIAVGLVASTASFISLYRRAHVEPATGDDDV